MPDILDLAQTIIHYEPDKSDRLFLQKMSFLWYAYAVSMDGVLLLSSKSEDESPFEAWQYGPVHRKLYEYTTKFSNQELVNQINGKVIDDDSYIKSLKKVLYLFKDFNSSELVSETHKPNSPWGETKQNDYIRISKIKEYYHNLFVSYEKAFQDMPKYASLLIKGMNIGYNNHKIIQALSKK